jgi:hypothetical protein
LDLLGSWVKISALSWALIDDQTHAMATKDSVRSVADWNGSDERRGR